MCGNKGPLLAWKVFLCTTITLCVLLRFLLKRYPPCPRSMEWYHRVVALNAVSGADGAVSKGHLSILWAADYYDCGCSHVGPWILLSMAICRLFDTVVILEKLVSTEVEWKYHFSLDFCTNMNSLSRFGHIMQALFLGVLLVKAEIDIWKAYCAEDKLLSLCS